MEKKDYLGYLKKFGLGERSGVDLSGELGGDISNLDYEVNVNYATAAFGQGISMTPLQLGMAVGVIANGGALMEPLIFEGDRVREVDRVISPETALSVASMMQGAIEGYSGASVPGFSLAGKTGTAQIAEAGGYADYKWTHSFVGFGPIGDAKFVVLLKLDQPQGVRYATTSLSSSFKNLATFLLGFYKIAPSFQIEEEVLD
jgi:cell division protein FtsI/penicillin-binding protein 2